MTLMTYEEYMGLYPTWPHTYILTRGDACLYYFGEAHSFDPTHPQWLALRVFWAEYLLASEGKERVVCIEGGLNHGKGATSADEAVLRGGGPGLTEYLAHEEGIVVESPEPPEAWERSELEKAFTRDEIQYYYFARVVLQWSLTQEPRMPFDTYIGAYLDADKRNSGWPDYDFSLAHMKDIHRSLAGKEFDATDAELFSAQADPARITSRISEVARESSIVRDLYITDKLAAHVRAGRSVFAHFGGSHAILQEPHLRHLLAN